MSEVANQFYNVMHKYATYFSKEGVQINLDFWSQNKDELISLLRRHPNWIEDELAVVSDIREYRDIDTEALYKLEQQMKEMMSEINQEEQYTFSCVLQYALSGHKTFLDDYNVRRMKGVLPDFKCAEGQKTSRAINRLCADYHLDKHPQFNAVFAQLADALNPLEVERKAVLSVHPCDFLEMSNEDNNWSSCHGLRDGCHKGGTLSYLNDGTSMIFYTLDADVEGNLYTHPKRTRQMYYFNDSKLLQSRLYPSERKERLDLYRNIVQGIIAACLGEADTWVVADGSDRHHHYSTHSHSLHYQDYKEYGALSLLDGKNHSKSAILIGYPGHCMCCGGALKNSSKLTCGCSHEAVCHDCGQIAEEPYYHDGVWLCKDCLHTCDLCNTKVRGKIEVVTGRNGEDVHLCPNCLKEAYEACQECSVALSCAALGTHRYCTRVRVGGMEYDDAA